MQMTLFDTDVDDKITNVFIKDLKKGSGFNNSKKRIRYLFKMDVPKSEVVNMLRDEYGIGGMNNSEYSQKHDSKGIEIKLNSNEEKLFSWEVVHDEIYKLIKNDNY